MSKTQVVTDRGPIHILVIKNVVVDGKEIQLPVRVYPTGGKPEKQFVK